MEGVSQQRRMVAALSYFLGFVTGIVVLMVEPQDKFIRFHAMQSTLSTGTLFILNIILGLVFSRFGIFSVISTFSGLVIWVAVFAFCVLGFFRAKQGRAYKLPYFGKWAEKKVG